MLISHYKIFDKHNLIIELHKGIVSRNAFKKFKLKLAEDPKFKMNCNFLVHIKNVKFKTSEKDLTDFADFIKSKHQILGKRRVAILTHTPEQVVSSMIYQSMHTKEENCVKVFSTNFEALKFLSCPLHLYKFFVKEIQKLKDKLH